MIIFRYTEERWEGRIPRGVQSPSSPDIQIKPWRTSGDQEVQTGTLKTGCRTGESRIGLLRHSVLLISNKSLYEYECAYASHVFWHFPPLWWLFSRKPTRECPRLWAWKLEAESWRVEMRGSRADITSPRHTNIAIVTLNFIKNSKNALSSYRK